jgi:hypothetical protein
MCTNTNNHVIIMYHFQFPFHSMFYAGCEALGCYDEADFQEVLSIHPPIYIASVVPAISMRPCAPHCPSTYSQLEHHKSNDHKDPDPPIATAPELDIDTAGSLEHETLAGEEGALPSDTLCT